jgi:hypothetical protein
MTYKFWIFKFPDIQNYLQFSGHSKLLTNLKIPVLLAMTKAFAQGLASMNIRVNCVAPGVIETRFSQAVS